MKTLGQVEYSCREALRIASADTTEQHRAAECASCQFLARLDREFEALRKRRLELLRQLKNRLGPKGDVVILDLR